MTVDEARKNATLFTQTYDLFSADKLAIDTLIECAKNAERYKWHDLRKNPDDLPERDGLYAVTIDYHGKEIGFGYWETVYGNGCGWACLMPCEQSVIAWKEIEPFMEVFGE